MSHVVRKPVLGFLTRSDTYWAAQQKKLARGLKFCMDMEEVLFSL